MLIQPDTLHGGALVKVLTAPLQRGWIEPADDGHMLSDAGCAAIGQQRPALPDAVQNLDTVGDLQPMEGIPGRPITCTATMRTPPYFHLHAQKSWQTRASRPMKRGDFTPYGG